MLLRMSGLTELCVAIFLGATAPGVNDFVQAILVLVGSFFALGSAGMYFYWRKVERTDEIRPITLALDAPREMQNAVSTEAAPPADTIAPAVVTAATQRQPTAIMSSVADNIQPTGTEALGAFEATLAASEMGLSDGNDRLMDTLMEVSGMSGQFSDDQAAAICARLAVVARTLMREAAQTPQMMVVATERLNVRASPNIDAHIIRKLPRNATISVVNRYPAQGFTTGGLVWKELASTEGQGGTQLTGAGWVCAEQGRTAFLRPA